MLCCDCSQANVNHTEAKFATGAGLTVKTAVPGIFGHTAAHRLVPLRDVTRSPVQTVVVANPLLAERPGEPDGAAACWLTWTRKTED